MQASKKGTLKIESLQNMIIAVCFFVATNHYSFNFKSNVPWLLISNGDLSLTFHVLLVSTLGPTMVGPEENFQF